ncbi:MAG: RNA polymerase sigma factor [Bacteroidetes bacterium]|nr:RNA polymerase sigma factor [Bacteroidota bacterium]MBS1942154.1 RNA polymerase sigma factor [Bacteroidota bacterium]
MAPHPDPRTAFMDAYAPCHAAFVRYCSALAYGRMDVQDLMQDVLLSAYSHFAQVRQKEELLHYLVRAARNRSISLWRSRRAKEPLAEAHANRLRAKGATPEQIADAGILYRAMGKLPALQREALVLFEVSGLSMAEVAAIQHTSEGTVKTRVSRARAALRNRLQGRAKPLRTTLVHLLILLP